MNAPRLNDQLLRMHECCQYLLEYSEDLEKNDFFEDHRTQQAVMMNLLVIGEIATKLIQLFPEFVAARAEIPWKSIKGMRNHIAHGYFEINFDVIWDTLQTAIPPLHEKLHIIINDSKNL
jgi:uncharacterized protein with HEPN domain